MLHPTAPTPAPREREAVVLLHSLGTDHNLWRPQATALAGRYRVLTPDSRGHGTTPWRDGVDLDTWVADLDALLEVALGDRFAPVHLVGLSMGGVQAIEYAAQRPDRVADLVLADTFAALPPEVARDRVDAMSASIETLGMERYADQYLQQTLVRPIPDSDRAALRAAIAGVCPTAYVASAEATFLTDHTPVLASIAQPTLVLVGEEDHKSPVALAAALTDGLPNAELRTIPLAGHLSNIENPDAFTAALTGFFASTTVMETTA